MSGMMTAVGGGYGSGDWSIVDPSSVAPGTTSLVGGIAPGTTSDFTTPALSPTGQPMMSTYAQPTASTLVAPYGTPAAYAQPATPNYAALQNASLGLAALGGGANANATTAPAAQDRVLYAHVAAPKPAAPAAPAPPRELEVKSGDTLSKLAEANGTTWEKLYELNKDVIGGDPNLIKPGQKLRLP